MDTLLELSAAFKKIIIGYKNLKLSQDNTLDNEPNSLETCIKNTLKIESSKSSHLALFHQVTLILDGMYDTKMSKVDRDNLAHELTLILKSVYALNHDGCSHIIKFNTIPYTLTTTLHYWGYTRGLSGFGILIRDFLLIPLGASSVTMDVAKINIESRVKVLFKNLELKEKEQLNLVEAAELRNQIEAQHKLIEQQKNQIQGLEQRSEQNTVSPTSGFGLFDENHQTPTLEAIEPSTHSVSVNLGI